MYQVFNETLVSSTRRALECKTSLRFYFFDRFRLTTADLVQGIEDPPSQAGLTKIRVVLQFVVVTAYR